MKKRRLLNLLLTSVMFISSILTPQMAHVVASTVNGENAEDTEQVNENDMPDVDAEDNVKEDDNTKAGDGGEEITDVTAEGETAEDEIEVITTDEADTGEPEKDGKETRGSPEVENVDESEADEEIVEEEQIEQIGAEANETERESTFDEDTIPEEEHNVLIEGKVDGAWHELGRISFNKHIDTRLIDFSVEVDELRITKLFGVEFNLDQVLLNGNSPIGEEKKLANIDNDVIDVVDSQIFKFPTKGSTFSISGRIPLYLDPPETHAFHSKWMEQDLTDLNGAFDDGPTVTIPDEKYLTAKDYLIPSSGHPAGDLSLFMSKDSDFLYVFGKVELDNTFDKGKDYLSIHIVDSKNQEYKVSTTEENEYGRWWFEYTDVGVDYQHMQYLVKIPLSDLKNPNNIQYKYEYYGTASAPMPVFMDIEKKFVDWESTEFTNEIYAKYTYFQLTNKNNPDMNTEVRIIPAGMRIESFEMEKNLLYFNVLQLLDKLLDSKEFHDTLMMKIDKAKSIASKYFDFDREITFKDEDFEEFYKKSEYDIDLALYEYSTEFRKHMDSYMHRYVHGFELKSEFLVPFINGEYVLNEIYAPSGYVIDTKKYPINLEFPLTIFDHDRSLFDNVQSEEEFIKIFNEYIEQRIIKPINAPTTIKNYPEDYKFNLPVEKIWIDEDGKFETRPDGITIQLLANGKPLEGGLIELNAANDYKHTFEDLPKHTEGEVKEEIIYTVEEVNVPNGYTSKITGSESEGYTITNTLKNTSIKGKKVWIDESNQAYSRPETITIKLLANGQEVENGTVEISTDTDMEFSFENLPIFTADNEEIEYTIEEVNIPEGYTAEITGNATDGFTVTNTYTPEVVDISVQKI